MDQPYEIITMRRRRTWTVEEKTRMIEETMQLGSSVERVAKRYDVSRSLLFYWRKQARLGEISGITPITFAPVQISAATPPASRQAADRQQPISTTEASSRVEIGLANGRTLRVDAEIDPVLLRRLIAAVEG